jgi:hypothetical protein
MREGVDITRCQFIVAPLLSKTKCFPLCIQVTKGEGFLEEAKTFLSIDILAKMEN